jgi:hypothetical protein
MYFITGQNAWFYEISKEDAWIGFVNEFCNQKIGSFDN